MPFSQDQASSGMLPEERQPRRLPALRALLGIVWAAPLTLVGLLLALPVLLGRGQLRVVRAATPALLVSGRVADYLLERHPFGAMCAMAIGHIIIADFRSLTPQILTHELEHVRQGAVWGGLFPFAYCGASLWAVLHGKDAYWNNRFEIAARRAERHA
ncbi:MAG: hypothetical protein JWP36_1114 [Paucimonas sp.]|nr:hypothetical protein [Paucimonas sp.]